MRCIFGQILGTAMIAALVAGTEIRGEEAVLPNGMRMQGTLRPGPGGRLQFLTASRAIGLPQLHLVRFASGRSAVPTERAVHRITLTDGQHLTGELIELDGGSVRVLSDWADKPFTIPRSAVLAVSQPPGRVTLLDEDFETGLQAWKTRGEPELSERQRRSGRQSLLLNVPGQSVNYLLPVPLESGRLSLSFFAAVPRPAGARWVVDAEFLGRKTQSWVSIDLAGPAGCCVREPPGVETVALTPTLWHRLSLECREAQLLVQVDDRVLHDARREPGDRLGKIRLRCLPGPAAAVLGGEVWIDDLIVTRFVDELPRPARDPEQDEVWLHAGDQLFGNVVRADRRSIQLQGRFGERTLSWADVRAVHFRQRLATARTTTGEHIRVWLGAGDSLDQVVGVLSSVDDRRLNLQHPVLGSLGIDRAWLRQLQWRFHGRRIDLDDGVHHLGQHLLPDTPWRPEGNVLRRTFALSGVPAEARLQVTVAHLAAAGDGATVARMLGRGGLRTEVVLNGRVIDYLNRHAARASAEPRRISVLLPAQAMRAGENVLELRQTVDQETGRTADCLISSLVIEIPG